jgi:hypothetical protein
VGCRALRRHERVRVDRACRRHVAAVAELTEGTPVPRLESHGEG